MWWWRPGTGWKLGGTASRARGLAVTLLLDHLNREGEPVAAPSGLRRKTVAHPAKARGREGARERTPARLGSKDSGPGGGGQGGGAGKPPPKGAPEKDYSYEYDEEDEEEEETSDDVVFHKKPRPLQATSWACASTHRDGPTRMAL